MAKKFQSLLKNMSPARRALIDSMTRKEIEMMPEQIAKVCHEVNRAYCHAIGDDSQVPWDEASVEQRESCRNGVRFHLENLHATPEESHANWMREKLDNGWTWGPEKNEDVKTHPCLVPYNELPQSQRVKDYLFKAVVDALRLA